MNVRTLDFWNAGTESPPETFARDQLSLLLAAWHKRAIARWWRAGEEGLSLGRYHRRDSRGGPAAGLVRRLSGGRIVPQGPGIACLTLAVPQAAWLDPGARALRPEQVLNRALRPLLAALRAATQADEHRGAAVDAFYPGRDLITVGGRALAHASFTVARDGALLVQMQVGDRSGFDALPQLLERFDPGGVAGADKNAFAGATSFSALTGAGLDDCGWSRRLVAAFESELRCQVRIGEPWAASEVTLAHPAAFTALQHELGPLAEDSARAGAISMLGVVEAGARLEGDRLRDVRLSGDLIAPFHTLDALSAGLEGQPARLPALRRVLARVLSQPGEFILGVRDLEELLARLATG